MIKFQFFLFYCVDFRDVSKKKILITYIKSVHVKLTTWFAVPKKHKFVTSLLWCGKKQGQYKQDSLVQSVVKWKLEVELLELMLGDIMKEEVLQIPDISCIHCAYENSTALQ